MDFELIEQIGKVPLKHIKRPKGPRPEYSDGSSEEKLYRRLLAAYEGGQGLERNGMPSEGDFVFEYHLSPVRHNLLKWYPFDAQECLLDIGTGCGALAGLFASKVTRVTALEYSPRRARITALRHPEQENLELIVGGLQDLETAQTYKYVTAIGVLEYAGTFFGGTQPHEGFLKKLAGLLRDDGLLILAIENKLGLKYIAGAPEDHTGLLFESLYDYPRTSRVRTFSRKELAELLSAAGFESQQWYYPFPDYKMPEIILSEAVAPKNLDKIWSLCPAKAMGIYRKEILSEKLFGRTLVGAGLFHEFSNSFLVVASKQQNAHPARRCLRFSGANLRRKANFRMETSLWEQDGRKTFRKTAATEESRAFLDVILEREKKAEAFYRSVATVVTGHRQEDTICYPHLPHPTLEELIADRLRTGSTDDALKLITEYVNLVHGLPVCDQRPNEFIKAVGIPAVQVPESLSCLSCGAIDLIPANILVEEKDRKFHIIDNEWFFDFPVPIDFVLWRGLETMVTNLQDYIQANVRRCPVVLVSGYGKNRTFMPAAWLNIFSKASVRPQTLAHWGALFERQVLRNGGAYHSRLREHPKVLHNITPLSTKVISGLTWRLNKAKYISGPLIRRVQRRLGAIWHKVAK
jgi:precorrin-6B methylase 2